MTTKPSYHHANLEQQLLDAAAHIVTSRGVSALSLRALGKLAGVSRSAPYHYFADKDELLHRLGERGFTMLAEATEAAEAGHIDPVARGRAGLQAYVRFAQDKPQLFRLMFAGVLPRRLSLPLGDGGSHYHFSSTAAAKAFARMQSCVTALPGSDVSDDNALMLRTNGVWAAVHGVAILAIDENLKLVAPESVLDLLLDKLIN